MNGASAFNRKLNRRFRTSRGECKSRFTAIQVRIMQVFLIRHGGGDFVRNVKEKHQAKPEKSEKRIGNGIFMHGYARTHHSRQ